MVRKTISITEYIARLLNWEKIKVECNKTTYQKIMSYKNQWYISNENTIETLTLEWLVTMRRKLKNIYLLD